VDGTGGDEQVPVGAVGERGHGLPDVPRDVRADVDDGIPGAVRKRGVVAGLPVAAAPFGSREQFWPGTSTVEQGDLVTAIEGVPDDRATDETGAPEDEYAHGRDLTAQLPAGTVGAIAARAAAREGVDV